MELIVADSKLWNTIKSDYLEGRLINAIWRNIVSMFDTTKTIIGRLSTWIVMKINHEEK